MPSDKNPPEINLDDFKKRGDASQPIEKYLDLPDAREMAVPADQPLLPPRNPVEDRIAMLEQRVEELERRVTELEENRPRQ